MQIRAKCPKCGHISQLALDRADRRIRCTSCKAMFKVPSVGELETPLTVAKNAGNTVFVDEEGKVYG
ncbi:MAG: hypothetical protein KAT00_13940 [Planctomycetes bacterium]|nr:hypothetical protein [Planctomycetota bacterium]